MNRQTTWFGGCVALSLAFAAPVTAQELKVISDKTVSGFGHIESIAYDPKEKVFYTGDFGPDLKPGDKDGKGMITKVSLDGKILEQKYLPPAGQTLNKPKGIWISGNRMWFTDIDCVWIVDLKTKQAKRLELPGVVFANDPAVIKNALYVTDNRSDQIVSVEPADFLNAKATPKITKVYSGKGISPNGIYPGKNGSLLIVGFKSKDETRGIYEMKPGQEPKLISQPIGMLDGLYQMKNGDILATDWMTSSLFQWNEKMGVKKLAGDFKGPADFVVIPNKQGLLVAVPDLVKGEMRLIQLGK